MGCKASKSICAVENPPIATSIFEDNIKNATAFHLYMVTDMSNDRDLRKYLESKDHKWYYVVFENKKEIAELHIHAEKEFPGIVDFVYYIKLWNLEDRSKSIVHMGFSQMEYGKTTIIKDICNVKLLRFGTEYVRRDYMFLMEVQIRLISKDVKEVEKKDSDVLLVA